MPEPPAFSEPVVYQLRVVLRGVSPLIWRRLLIRSDSTIADLHASLQRVLGWSDEHLNRFVMTAGSASVTILDTSAWPTLASASVSASCTSTTSPTAGNTSCGSSRSCRWTLGNTFQIPRRCRKANYPPLASD